MDKWTDAIMSCALIAGVTLAAIHFGDSRLLWFYLMLLIYV